MFHCKPGKDASCCLIAVPAGGVSLSARAGGNGTKVVRIIRANHLPLRPIRAAGPRSTAPECARRREGGIGMPGRDRTGPAGWGPGTGRGLGRCGGFRAQGFSNPAPWFDPRGRGGGLGRRNRFCRTAFNEWHPGYPGGGRGVGSGFFRGFPRNWEEGTLEGLKNQEKSLEMALEGIRNRIRELGPATERE